MTAPVGQQATAAGGRKIATTAPVAQRREGDGGWVIRFPWPPPRPDLCWRCAQDFSTASPSPHAAIALQWRNASWSSTTSLMSPVGVVPSATTSASNSIDRAVASVRSTVTVRRPAFSTPPTGAITNAVTPSAAVAFTNLATPARSEPASAMMPILRPSIGPGSASICTSAGETVTSSAGLPFGADRPRPAATCSHRSASTLASTWSSRSLIACS